MLSPITGKAMTLVVRPSTLNVRKEAFPVMYHVWKCEDTNEEFETEEFVELNISQATNQYRSKYNLPFPEEIKSIREKYGLSASKMSEILRFGINQYKQYENGDLPSESNASLIFLAQHPRGFLELIDLSNLGSEEKSSLVKQIIPLCVDEKTWQEKEWETRFLMGDIYPTIERGFRKPDLIRFISMVQYFSKQLSPFKTQMNKLLFYTDFLHFKRTGRSMSGAKYRAIEMGPVPNNFDALFQHAENEGFVKLEHHEYSNGAIGTRFLQGNRPFGNVLFNEQELESFQSVYERFKDTNGKAIIEISHQEEAWLKNAPTKSLISYLDSYSLQALR